MLTAGDRTYASSYLFTAGTTRPTTLASEMPNASHPGPTFGSLDATTIDLATATLDTIDGVSIADVNFADGFLTLGDGGVLSANFLPEVTIGSMLFLALGEVGGQPGEGIGARVTASDQPVTVPEASTLFLFAAGFIGFGFVGRKQRQS